MKLMDRILSVSKETSGAINVKISDCLSQFVNMKHMSDE